MDLSFGDHFEPNRYRLVELPADLAASLFPAQSSSQISSQYQPNVLVFRSTDEDSEVVLCSNDTTYAVRQASISNTVLVCRPRPSSVFEGETHEIVDTLSSYLELTRVQPRLANLRNMLKNTALYAGPAEEGRILKARPVRYTWNDLRDNVQARFVVLIYASHLNLPSLRKSDHELRLGLENLNAIEIEGYWRLLDTRYVAYVIEQIIASCNILGQSTPEDLSAVSLIAIVGELKSDIDDIPEDIVHHILKVFSDSSEHVEPNDVIFKLSDSKVCRFFGEEILKEKLGNRRNAVADVIPFLKLWSSRVPDTFTVSMDMLKGIALIGDAPQGKVLSYFTLETLLNSDPRCSSDLRTRLKILFDVRRRWAHDEIIVYLKDLEPDQKALDAFLLKNARLVTISNEGAQDVFYTPRFG
ncbi:sister chromatid cohesion protein Dcc1 [Cladochytrium replicatum]|nr:sister chromatid cohesion protein Dcc1 [Cladochytrium replicatum]